ncbi:hypothetical protein JR316_0009681 [Psilocybe cubensis]|uniref:Uncharacterized protein n=2 Tax=Psilocybe cubensis TaxID=181762 RepID=A0ACB8GPH6_PSICU|nr:hypothetical protein JR316_0009681 [Psilocybe cubensis]KAH9477466.1 hypothetical protein JR316_0009681 [Psilocybe cubensis]
MELPQLSLDTYVAICLVIATPWLYRTFSPFSEVRTKTRTEQLVSTTILTHTLYMLYCLFVSPPQNVFTSLGVPMSAAPEELRVKLAERFGSEEHVPEYLRVLVKRLGLMDMRSLYIRFGHDVLTTCSYCQSFDDFALYAFPSSLLEYVREIAFVGLLTLPKTPTAHFRPVGLGVLLAALLIEAYWVLTVPVLITPRGSDTTTTMWHDTFILIRHTLFLLLPLITTLAPHLELHRVPILNAFIPAPETANLPPSRFQMQGQGGPVLPDGITLNQISNMTLKTLGHLVPTLHLLKYSHAAIMRSQPSSADAEDSSTPSQHLHARASEWWREERREGDIVRNDANVRHVLKASGLSLDDEVKAEDGSVVQPEGPLLNSAKIAANMLKEQGAPPSEFWVFMK